MTFSGDDDNLPAGGDPRERDDHVPANLEAEQAVLGALMFDNAVAADIDGMVTALDFAEPFHGRLFSAILEKIGAGVLAEPNLLMDRFREDPAFGSLGGVRYLADLVDRAPPTAYVVDYAATVRETSQRRQIIEAAGELLRRARHDSSVSAMDLVDVAERSLLGIQMTTRTTALVTADEAVRRVLEELENPAVSHGVQTGLGPIDQETGGFQPGEVWILAGRPSMGKSALASTMALHVSRHGRHPDGRPLGWIELNGEMTVPQMMRRHISDLAFELSPREAPSYSKIRKRSLTVAERNVLYAAAAEIRGLETLRMVKRTGMTLLTLRSLIRRQAAAWERQGIALGGVSIDHGGLIRVEDARRGRTEAQTEVAIGVKDLADELGVPLVVLLQLNRQVESRDDKRPQLSDLRDSGAWEENADGVIGVYRDAYYAQRETEPKKADLRYLWEERKSSKTVEALLLKIREGEAGKIDLWADMPRNAIRGVQPDNLYGGGPRFDFLDPDAAMPTASPPRQDLPPPAGDTTPAGPPDVPPAYSEDDFR